MKNIWKKPVLEVLDISMTMNGPGNAVPDCHDAGEETHDGMSNNSCKNGLGS